MFSDHLGYQLRPFEKADAEAFYETNFRNLDPELMHFTGTDRQFSKEEVVTHIQAIVDQPDRYDFVLVSPDQELIGETVINTIDLKTKSANFRIAIYQNNHHNKGLGAWATQETVHYAFEVLKLNRLSLEVFDFNQRAIKVYQKAGFITEGRLRQAHKTQNGFADIIIMSIIAEDYWRT